MSAPTTTKHNRSFADWVLWTLAGVFLLPFIYLLSLAVLHSAYVHGWSFPSRRFLQAYAGPSNVMAVTPGVGRLFEGYYDVCTKLTGADYDPNAKP